MTVCARPECGAALTARQVQKGGRYCSRRCACVHLGPLKTPEAIARSMAGVKRRAVLERIDRWGQPAFERLMRQIDGTKLTRRELAATKVVLADLVTVAYRAGWRYGYSTRQQHEVRGTDLRRRQARAGQRGRAAA